MLVCVDTTDEQGLKEAERWLEIGRRLLSKHDEAHCTLVSNISDSPYSYCFDSHAVILVGTKSDLVKRRVLTATQLEEAAKANSISKWFECSAVCFLLVDLEVLFDVHVDEQSRRGHCISAHRPAFCLSFEVRV